MPDAQSILGVMYANGRGVPQDYAEAVKWYRLAADQGDAEAQHNLGVMYASGEGVSAGLRRGGEMVPARCRHGACRSPVQPRPHV